MKVSPAPRKRAYGIQPTRITVMLADDHPGFMDGIKYALEKFSNLSVIGMAKNGRQLLNLVQKEQPDLVIIDLSMPVLSGFELVPIIKEDFPAIRVIVLSQYDSPGIVSEMINSGADAYIYKGRDIDDILFIVDEVYKHGHYFDDWVANNVLPGFCLNTRKYIQQSLNYREKQILKYIAEGFSAREIGEFLKISEDGVDFHRKNIYRKTKCKDITELVRYAIKSGISRL